MFDRRARRRTLVVVAASLVVVSGTALASASTWSTSADFLGCALTSTVVDADAVVLDTSGTGRPTASIPWWDASWGQRRCVTITNNEATPLTEYQIVVAIDTATPIAAGRMSPTGADLRAIAADGATLLGLWIEGPIDDPATAVWVQTDTLSPGDSDIRLDDDNPGATTVSDPLAPFTYTTPRPL